MTTVRYNYQNGHTYYFNCYCKSITACNLTRLHKVSNSSWLLETPYRCCVSFFVDFSFTSFFSAFILFCNFFASLKIHKYVSWKQRHPAEIVNCINFFTKACIHNWRSTPNIKKYIKVKLHFSCRVLWRFLYCMYYVISNVIQYTANCSILKLIWIETMHTNKHIRSYTTTCLWFFIPFLFNVYS